jgi:MoaA/NifB/PqqE/SkfB family radical SAM enzyme
MKPGHFVIMPTFRCNISCDHCQHACNPERREAMSLGLFRTIASQAVEAGFSALCLSGGEVFLLPDYLKAAADICKERSKPLIVQTNGFWGRNRNTARRQLRSLEGIAQIGFSIDSSHLRHIPIETVIGAMDAAVDAGITKLSVSISYKTQEECNVLSEELGRRFPGISIVGWPVLPVGRAALHPELFAEVPDYPWECLQRSCGAQVDFSPVVHPGGELHFCYRVVMALERSDPLILGNCSESSIDRLLSSASNRLASFLVSFGGGGLGYLLLNSPFEGRLSDRYHSVCHFCYSILSDPQTANYVLALLSSAELDARIAEGFERACWKASPTKAQRRPSKRIQVCNGKHCGKGKRNHPLIHYLLNRLVETGKSRFVDVKVVDCLNSCETGPNFRIVDEKLVMKAIVRGDIDRLVDRLTPPEEESNRTERRPNVHIGQTPSPQLL